MELKVNCADCRMCQREAGTQRNNTVSFKINLDAGQVTRQTHLGREFAIVPVVMMKSGVVMNDSLVPTEELNPLTWNGVPVTVGHPLVNGRTVSANAPSIIEDWAVGTIYHTRVEGGDLKAEAWLDVERINRVRPGLLEELEAGTQVDVSTGYFSDDIAESGTINGKTFRVVSRNLNPDHLALLPDVSGACSWEDGCGVRANERSDSLMTEPEKEEKLSVNAFTKLLGAMGLGLGNSLPVEGQMLKTQERGEDDDFRQMVADLISDDRSPFLPEDEYALREMSLNTLKKVRDKYLGGGVTANESSNPHKEKGDPPVVDKSKEEVKANDADAGLPQTKQELQELIANSVAEALKTNAASSALTAEQQEAIDRAMKINADHRAELIQKIVTNSNMAEEVVSEWPTAQLEVVANGLKVVAPNYGGRAAAPVVNAAEDDVVVNSMVPPSTKTSADKKVH